MARGMKSFLRPLDIRRPGLKNLVHPRREPLRERLVPVVAAPFRFPAPPRLSEGRKLSLLTELHAKKVDLYLHQQGLDTSRAMFQMVMLSPPQAVANGGMTVIASPHSARM